MAMFAPGLIESFNRLDEAGVTLHLHLVSDDDAAIRAFRGLVQAGSGVSGSVERTRRHNTYYACSRFMVAPTLLARCGKPVVTVDLDVILLRPLAPVLRLVADADVARFSYPNPPLPSMAVLATYVVLNPSPGTIAYLGHLNGLIQAKIDIPRNWMLDQAAMFSVERLNEVAPFCRIVDLSLTYPEPGGGGLIRLPEHRDKMAARLANQ